MASCACGTSSMPSGASMACNSASLPRLLEARTIFGTMRAILRVVKNPTLPCPAAEGEIQSGGQCARLQGHQLGNALLSQPQQLVHLGARECRAFGRAL